MVPLQSSIDTIQRYIISETAIQPDAPAADLSWIQTVTIPPTTRKRKAAEATISSASKEDSQPNAKRVLASASLNTIAAAPLTPHTTVSNGMDSEDEYMSAMSSDDDAALDDSDNEDLSGGEEG